MYYLQKPIQETAGTARGVVIQEKQPEVVSLEFGFLPKDATFHVQVGGEDSCVEEENNNASAKDAVKLQTKEERKHVDGDPLDDS